MSPVDADASTKMGSAARRVYNTNDLRIAIFECCNFDFLKSTGIILNRQGFETAVARLWKVVASKALERDWHPNARSESYRSAIRYFIVDARGPRKLLSKKRFFSRSLHDLDLGAVQARYPSLVEFSVWYEDSPRDVQFCRSIFRWAAKDRLWDHVREHFWEIDLGDPEVEWCLFALEESVPPAWPEIPGARGDSLTAYVEIDGRFLTQDPERLFQYLAQSPATLRLRLLGSETDLDSFEHLIDEMNTTVAQRKANALPDILDLTMNWSSECAPSDEDDDSYWLHRPFFDLEPLFIGLGSTLTCLDMLGRLDPRHLWQLLSAVEEHCVALRHMTICYHLPRLTNDEIEGQALMPLGTHGRTSSLDVWCYYEPTLYGYDIDEVDWRDFDREIFTVVSSLARLVCSDCSLTFTVGETAFDLSEVSHLIQSATFASSCDEMSMSCCAPVRSHDHLELKQVLDKKLDEVWDAIVEDWEIHVLLGWEAEASSEPSDDTAVTE